MRKNMNPLVSVLMCVYNTKEEYLRIAIESILNQTITDFEFIIVNDYSDEKTIDIIYQYKDDRIIHINNEINLGLTVSLNRGLEIAKGQYIARMDSDDISYPKRLEWQLSYMEKHNNVAVLGGWTSTNGKIAKYQGHASSEWRKTRMLIENVGIAHPTAFIRSDFLKANHLKYDVRIRKSQDYELWTRCLLYGKMAICPHIVLEYRVHADQISAKNFAQQVEAKKLIRIQLLKTMGVEFEKEELEQFLDMENIVMNPKDFSTVLDKLVLANKKKKLYSNSILKMELTLIWLKVITGKYNSIERKRYRCTHWFRYMFSPFFVLYLLWNTFERNI